MFSCRTFSFDSYTITIETGFYYLQSRYYDPVVKRFLNADSYASTGQGFLGYNMFAYCGNNPCSLIDNSGNLSAPSIDVEDGLVTIKTYISDGWDLVVCIELPAKVKLIDNIIIYNYDPISHYFTIELSTGSDAFSFSGSIICPPNRDDPLGLLFEGGSSTGGVIGGIDKSGVYAGYEMTYIISDNLELVVTTTLHASFSASKRAAGLIRRFAPKILPGAGNYSPSSNSGGVGGNAAGGNYVPTAAGGWFFWIEQMK